jgi:hypothetical protein
MRPHRSSLPMSFVAYQSDESGRPEFYIRSFPDGGHRERVSIQGGVWPSWRADGKELFYVEGDTMMAVPVTTSPSLTVGALVTLFSVSILSRRPAPSYDVTPDGTRFVLSEPGADGGRCRSGSRSRNYSYEFQKTVDHRACSSLRLFVGQQTRWALIYL